MSPEPEPAPITLSVDDVEADAAGRLDAVVQQAASALEAGGAVVVPTDTVYGVAARLDRPDGLDRLFELKRRDRSNPLAVLVAHRPQALGLVDRSALDDEVAEAVAEMMDRGWPGALTLVVPRKAEARGFDLGGDAATIGVRCPSSPVVRALAAASGPLATTSANRSGDPTPSTAAAAARALAGSVDLVIDAGPCTERPSTVVDVTGRPFRILRQGSAMAGELGVPADWFDDGAVRGDA